jgi:hypothetical protein
VKLFVAAVLAVALTAPAVAQMPDDIRQLRFAAQPQLPAPTITRRPLPPTPVEAGSFGTDHVMNVSGTLTVEQVASGRFRMTFTAARIKGRVGTQQFDTALSNVRYTDVEFDSGGRHFALQPAWLGLPQDSPSPQVTPEQWQRLRGALVDGQKDWVANFAGHGAPVTLPNDIAIGTAVMPRDLAEMLAHRLELLDAMVRGNAGGFHVDLPRGGTLTTEQRDLYAGFIRARGLPRSLQTDVRIRGTTVHTGRSYIVADGITKVQVTGANTELTTTVLFDPASGWVALSRVVGTTVTTVRSTSIGAYWRLRLP